MQVKTKFKDILERMLALRKNSPSPPPQEKNMKIYTYIYTNIVNIKVCLIDLSNFQIYIHIYMEYALKNKLTKNITSKIPNSMYLSN